MEQEITYKVSKSDLTVIIKDIFKEELKNIAIESFLNKYENIEVSTSFLCELWKVSKNSIGSYIKFNLIKPINPGSSKLLFNLKDILSIENPKFRRSSL